MNNDVIERYFHLLDNYHLAGIHENVTLSRLEKKNNMLYVL
ncbi:unnamed protein product [Spodoptera exigua]|nr:unnamed protein product [Spodoptera exigua]